MAEMKAAGMRWVAVNVGDGLHWEDWRIVRERAVTNGIEILPWARCWNLTDCQWLLGTADVFSRYCILNIEDELATTLSPARVASLLPDYLVPGGIQVAISTVGWLYNDVDFRPLSELPVLLQLFPTDMRRQPAEMEKVQRDCVWHARDKGFQYVAVTYQTYGGAKPEWYAFHKGTRSYFAGDDVGYGNWKAWRL